MQCLCFPAELIKGAHHIEGIGDDFIPAVVDQTLVDGVMDINDLDAIAMAAKFGPCTGPWRGYLLRR